MSDAQGPEIVVVPAPAPLPSAGAPPEQPAPPAPPVLPVQLVLQAPKPPPVYDGGLVAGYCYKPGLIDPQKVGGDVSSSSLVDNARRGPQPTICEHNLPKSKCKKCKAMARICKHGKKKELCRECDGSALCIHDLRKKVCEPSSVHMCVCFCGVCAPSFPVHVCVCARARTIIPVPCWCSPPRKGQIYAGAVTSNAEAEAAERRRRR
jgi:hypothetical protein